jgi:hypothetical protein
VKQDTATCNTLHRFATKLAQLICSTFRINGSINRAICGDWVHLVRRPLFGLLYRPRMVDECGVVGGMRIGRGNISTRGENVLVPQIPHNLGSNPGRRGEKPATNRLSYSTANPFVSVYSVNRPNLTGGETEAYIVTCILTPVCATNKLGTVRRA